MVTARAAAPLVVACSIIFLVLLGLQGHGRQGELLAWGPPSLMPNGIPRGASSASLARDRDAEGAWGPPALMPPRARGAVRKANKGGMTIDIRQDGNEDTKLAPITIELVSPYASEQQQGKDPAPDMTVRSSKIEMTSGQHSSLSAAGEDSRMVRDVPASMGLARSSSVDTGAAAEATVEKLVAVHTAPAHVSSPSSQNQRISAKSFMQKLSALYKEQGKVEHEHEGAGDDIATTRDLATRARTLRAEVDDLRKSVVTQSGVEKLHKLESELEDVKRELRHMPELLPAKVKQAGLDIYKTRVHIEHLRERIFSKKRNLEVEREVEGKSEKVRGEEREMEAKVELKRVQQDVLADLMGQAEPKHKPLSALTEGLDVQKQVREDEKSLASMQEKLTHAQEHLRLLMQDKEELEADIKVIQSVHDTSYKARSQMLAQAPTGALATALAQDSPPEAAEEGKEAEDGEGEADNAHNGVLDEYEKEPTNEDGSPKPLKGLQTFDAVKKGLVKTPQDVQQVADSQKNEDEPRMQWCSWGSELVPCAPGYGGAYYEPGKRHVEGGIWPLDRGGPLAPSNFEYQHERHVKAGGRSHSYFDDIFSYGKAGIFGAKGERPKMGLKKGLMLSGGHTNSAASHGGLSAGMSVRAGQKSVWAAQMSSPDYIEELMKRDRARMGAFARPPAETQQTFPDDTAIMREERLSGAYRVARRGDTEMSDALAQTRAKQLQRLRDLAGV